MLTFLSSDYNKRVRKTIYVAGLLFAGFVLGWLVFSYFGGPGSFPGRLAGRFGMAPSAVIRLARTSDDFTRVVKAVSPSVVNISSQRVTGEGDGSSGENDPFSESGGEQNLGSGVIVSPEGYIITNYHVIADADHITVTLLDNRSYDARVIGADPKTDLALLKIDASGLPIVRWGNSDSLEAGEFVLAIGNPFSLSHTVTMGIISAVGRANVGIADYEDFIQTDAAINPGNSGGPLVDERGEVIGINTAIFSKSGSFQGIGFAVPSNMVIEIMRQLKTRGKVIRGWIGVTMQDLTPDLAEKFGLATPEGALVSDVTRGGPAWRAGIRRGDIIGRFGGKPVSSPAVLKNLVAEASPGQEVPIDVVRGRQRLRLTAGIEEYPADMLSSAAETRPARPETPVSVFSGLGVMELTRDISRQLGLPQTERGVVVADVDEGSPSGDGGLRRGDVIEEIERRPVRTLADFNAVVSRFSGTKKPVLLLVNRAGKRSYVLLKQN